MCPFAHRVGMLDSQTQHPGWLPPPRLTTDHLTLSADGDSQLNPAVVDTVLTGIPGPRGPPGPPGE
jgi:hypothetical protein